MIACIPLGALAQASGRSVGGHIGVASPLVMINSDTTKTISDKTVIANPIGVSVKMSDNLVIDFETIVQSQIRPSPRGNSSLVVDPGVVYNFGPAAVGLRLAFAIGAPVNVGLIPLINRGIADLGGATWFVEAAFPTFLHSDPDPRFSLDMVLHTGIAF